MSKNENSKKPVVKKAKYLPDIGEKPHQPKIMFKKTKIFGTLRSFAYKWFLEFPWLHYSEADDKAYCFYCVRCIKMKLTHENCFSKATAFTYDGFNFWNKGPERFKMHQNSEEHKEAKCKIEAMKLGPVDEILNQQCESQRAANRRCLLKIIENVHFCALTNSPFRGHEEKDSFFQKLADLRGKDNADFQQWIEKKQKGYLSKNIQNELLAIMSMKLLRENVLKPIQEGYFSQQNITLSIILSFLKNRLIP